MATKIYKSEIDSAMPGDMMLLHLKKAWCFRELWTVVIVLGLMSLSLASTAPVLGLVPILALAGAAATLPEVRDPLLSWWETGSRRRFETFSEISWPYTCRELGWTQSASNGDFYIPDLVNIELSGDGSRTYFVRPLSTQKPKMWPQMAEQLSRYLGAPTHRWEEVAPGVLAIHGVVETLPDTADLDLTLHSSNVWDQVPLGAGVGAPVTYWVPSEIPHLLVAGATNSGKGSVLRLAAIHALQSGWQVMAINPRMSGEFTWMKNLDVPVAADLDQTLSLLKTAWEEMQRRQVIVEISGVSSWTKLEDRTWPPVMVVVDEAATLLTPNKANKQIAAKQLEIGDLLARMAAIGRAVGFHLVMATQRPDAAALGPAGGALRNNVEGRIAVGSLDPDGLRMMFGSSDPETIGRLDGVKGRALAAKLTGGDVRVQQVQLFYADEAKLLANPPRLAVPQLGGTIQVEASAA